MGEKRIWQLQSYHFTRGGQMLWAVHCWNRRSAATRQLASPGGVSHPPPPGTASKLSLAWLGLVSGQGRGGELGDRVLSINPALGQNVGWAHHWNLGQ